MKDRDLYTRGQILLIRYCRQENIELIDLIDSDKALIRCPDGGFSRESGRKNAPEGDNPHTLSGPQEWPTKWTNVDSDKNLTCPDGPKIIL